MSSFRAPYTTLNGAADDQLSKDAAFRTEGNAERRAGSQRPPITNSREDRHVTHMALMDREATLRALSWESGSFAGQQVTARIVRRRCFKTIRLPR
ncbi:hypothetical protein TNCV_3949581 [Trichonephila clavipes]|nr:hypothetical protein TNCV_3949581 [Trichonephila clavipes]